MAISFYLCYFSWNAIDDFINANFQQRWVSTAFTMACGQIVINDYAAYVLFVKVSHLIWFWLWSADHILINKAWSGICIDCNRWDDLLDEEDVIEVDSYDGATARSLTRDSMPSQNFLDTSHSTSSIRDPLSLFSNKLSEEKAASMLTPLSDDEIKKSFDKSGFVPQGEFNSDANMNPSPNFDVHDSSPSDAHQLNSGPNFSQKQSTQVVQSDANLPTNIDKDGIPVDVVSGSGSKLYEKCVGDQSIGTNHDASVNIVVVDERVAILGNYMMNSEKYIRDVI
ncbi:hypothetical protein L6452_25060 [Arctium lappa]|uniref:Uncharacterized protein n=1 Tax=Arctium lappa TaxID=4217 RepID=A0ACB9AC71_ARCLA|nr:hypothetical protein L6452_25060 [Arctium lappa]